MGSIHRPYSLMVNVQYNPYLLFSSFHVQSSVILQLLRVPFQGILPASIPFPSQGDKLSVQLLKRDWRQWIRHTLSQSQWRHNVAPVRKLERRAGRMSNRAETEQNYQYMIIYKSITFFLVLCFCWVFQTLWSKGSQPPKTRS